MANDTTKNPFILDSFSATPFITDRIRVRKIRWIGATAAAQATLKDGAGRVVWDSFCPANNTPEDQSFLGVEGDFKGLALTALGSGKVYIYYG